jgi:hypothetical protein
LLVALVAAATWFAWRLFWNTADDLEELVGAWATGLSPR